jgi:cytochrome b subunit of formate dehydrogenase
VHELTSAAKLAPAKCAECHGAEVKEFRESIHGQAEQASDPDAPKCASCHGPIHNVRMADDPASTVAKKNLPDTCAACHSNNEFLSRHKIPVAHPVEKYRQSVHGRAVMAGKNAATCSDCHGSHAIFEGRDSRSHINHWNVAATCGQCHKEIARQFNESVHGVALKNGARDAPDCTNCHGEHLILEPSSPASALNAANISVQTCGRCHADTRLARMYDLPVDRVPSYADSYHGLAVREGQLTAANCASCHGVHDILRSSDPRSTVNAANLRKTCGQCHQGIGEKLAIGPVHVRTAVGPNHPVVKWIRWTYLVLIPATLGFMFLHNLLDLLSKLIRRRPRHETSEVAVRMNLWFRVAHWGIMVSFPTLVVTGFALKFPESWWARPLVAIEGGYAIRAWVHRAAGAILTLAAFYHLGYLLGTRRGRSQVLAMWPRWQDVRDAWDLLGFNLGLRHDRPRFHHFTYGEKIEYWAVIWGTTVMATTGYLMWYQGLVLRHWPLWSINLATVIHYYEAWLAVLAILIWHFYHVIFRPDVYPMSWAWLSGKLTGREMAEEHPAELEDILAAERRVGSSASDEQASGFPERPAPSSTPENPEHSVPGEGPK